LRSYSGLKSQDAEGKGGILTSVGWQVTMGALQRGPGGPWLTQNFGWVGHNALGPTNIGMYVP